MKQVNKIIELFQEISNNHEAKMKIVLYNKSIFLILRYRIMDIIFKLSCM